MGEDRQHSLLSPSAAHRWLRCQKSARLTEDYPDKGSDYAAEGTLAHDVAEKKLLFRLNSTKRPSKCADAEMDSHTDDYCDFIFEQMAVMEKPQAIVELKVDCTAYVPECKGTVDCLLIAAGVIHVIDFKYGRGVPVDADGNEQLRLYALGAIAMFGFLYDIETVRMSIFQPRINNCTTAEMSCSVLEQWAEDTLKPKARLAWEGEGEFKAGDHCMFCKAKAECRTRAEQAMELAKLDFKRPPLLEDDEVESILDRIDNLVAWASDIKEYALQAALGGKKWNDYKLVEGRSNRKYTNETTVAETVSGAGFNPYEQSVLGITAMEKMLGKKKFSELLGDLVEKPKGKPTLVPRTDKRSEINTAKNDFMEE